MYIHKYIINTIHQGLVSYFGYGRFILLHFPPECYCSKRYNSKNLWFSEIKSSGSVVSSGHFRFFSFTVSLNRVKFVASVYLFFFILLKKRNLCLYKTKT